MSKMKLGSIADEKPVRITAKLPAAVHRDLVAYAETLTLETGQAVAMVQLVGPMLARFMATDRAFAKARRLKPGQVVRAVPAGRPPLPNSENV